MNPPSLADLHKQLEIDKSALDDEVIRQPSLFYMVSEQLVEASAERDAAKEDLAMVDAELDAHWRTALNTGTARVTDKAIQSHIQTSQRHKDAFIAYLDAKAHADKLLVLKESFQQRSYMLRDLVSLYTANYYEESSIRPTKTQEASQYAANRVRISNARAAREK